MTEMTPADVPQDLLDAAMKAPWDLSFPDKTARSILVAVLPLYEQQLREQIAGELYGLPIARHLGIPRSNATQHAADVAEAAQRWMITVVQRPDLVPESTRDEAHLSARVRENPAWPADLLKLRSCGRPTGGDDA